MVYEIVSKHNKIITTTSDWQIAKSYLGEWVRVRLPDGSYYNGGYNRLYGE